MIRPISVLLAFGYLTTHAAPPAEPNAGPESPSEHANAFARKWLRCAIGDKTENLVICPPGVRNSLLFLADHATGDTRSGLVRAAESPAQITPREIEKIGATKLYLNQEQLTGKRPDTGRWKTEWDIEVAAGPFSRPNGEIRHAADRAIGPGLDPARFSFILENTVTFDGKWASGFSAERTRLRDFTRLDGKTVALPMMHRTDATPYAELGDATAVALRYQQHADYRLLLVLPRPGLTPQQWLAGETGESTPRWQSRLAPKDLLLALPRFEIRQRHDLKVPLLKFGAWRAFSDKADFTPLGLAPGLRLERAAQAIHFKINEQGTKAIASTSMAGAPFGDPPPPPPPPPQVVFDRPFLFFLVKGETLLFAGVFAGREPATRGDSGAPVTPLP